MTYREHREAAASFEAFVTDHQIRLFGALCLMTGDRFEAEEIAQEAFLRVFERWDRVAAMEDPAGYLFRVSMNVFRTRRRRAALALRRTIRVAPEPNAFDAAEDREVVLRALARVSRDERAALVVTSLYGLSSDEASPVESSADPQADPQQDEAQESTGADLYLISPKTGATRLLLRAPGNQTSAEQAPNGKLIAYESESGGPSQVFVLESDGRARQLTHMKGGAYDPTWSPDGRQIAFAARERRGADTDIFVMDPDGARTHRLLGTKREDRRPTWSPDGAYVAFDTGDDAELVWTWDVLVGSVRDGVLTRPDVPCAAADAEWSPDGGWIAFACYDAHTMNGWIHNAHVWVMRPDGAERRPIHRPMKNWWDWQLSASWSPSGRSLAFTDGGWGSPFGDAASGDGRIGILHTGAWRITYLRTSHPVSDLSWDTEWIIASMGDGALPSPPLR